MSLLALSARGPQAPNKTHYAEPHCNACKATKCTYGVVQLQMLIENKFSRLKAINTFIEYQYLLCIYVRISAIRLFSAVVFSRVVALEASLVRREYSYIL